MPVLTRPDDEQHDEQPRDDDQAQPDAAVPEPPALLDAFALEVWKLLAGSLKSRNAYQPLDRHTIGRYCWYFHRWWELAKVVQADGEYEEREGRGGKKYRALRPEVRQIGIYEAILVRLEKLLGITPGARARIKELLEGDGKSELDEFVDRKGRGRPPHAPQ